MECTYDVYGQYLFRVVGPWEAMGLLSVHDRLLYMGFQ